MFFEVPRDYSEEDYYSQPLGIKHGKVGSDDIVKAELRVYSPSGKRQAVIKGLKASSFSRTVDGKKGLPYARVEDGGYIKYRIDFTMTDLTRGKTTLLATPVFDDITIFYSEGIKIISYVEQS